jgi:AcrR family transcriptional regulator
MSRNYELKQRAVSQAATRQKIVDATVALHASVGPARTTITAIAQSAGVQRLTVYRHFPDEQSLYRACGGQWMALNPLPDPAGWAAVGDPGERMRLALGEIYAQYRTTESMTANVLRDLPELPALQEVIAPQGLYWHSVRSALARGWGVRGSRRRRLRAVIGHAVEFETWRSLARQGGLDDGEAAELMVQLARAV